MVARKNTIRSEHKVNPGTYVNLITGGSAQPLWSTLSKNSTLPIQKDLNLSIRLKRLQTDNILCKSIHLFKIRGILLFN